MVTQVNENIFYIHVPLPNNPLKELNTYFIRGNSGEKNLLIDTGFNRPECYDALIEGMRELRTLPEETDVFLTHVHSDHSGNAGKLSELGCRIIMGETDYQFLTSAKRMSSKVKYERFIREGMSEEIFEKVILNNPAYLYAPGPFKAETVHEGTLLSYGGYNLEVIETPGHTPGHQCLYDREKKLIFLGDHVLFDITPNITFWSGVENSLKDYLNSLDKISRLDIETALPAHRKLGQITVYERIDQLKEHHRVRLEEFERIVREEPGLNAYDITGRMTWNIRTRNWDEFPPGQKWFAVGEALAHADYLLAEHRVTCRTDEETGLVTYYPV